MARVDASAYFAARAPRYQEALRVCPAARALDYLPYYAALALAGLNLRRGLRVCDAFGGTGFLARSFARYGAEIVVADVCSEMLRGASGLPNVKTHVTDDDFASVAGAFGSRSFDLVVTHGGLHHVVELSDGTPNLPASRARQARVVGTLASLVRPGGLLVVADIPDSIPTESRGSLTRHPLTESHLELGLEEGASIVSAALGVKPENLPGLHDLQALVESRLWAPVAFPVPRRFFDEFIAPSSPMGHVAVYPDFQDLHARLLSCGMSMLGRINYKGPWIFSSPQEAGWFFREKFSLYTSGDLGTLPETERAVFEVVNEFLGSRPAAECTAVNWGVTYAAYLAANV